MQPTLLFEERTGNLLGVFTEEATMEDAMDQVNGGFMRVPVERVENWPEFEKSEYVNFRNIRLKDKTGITIEQPK